MKKPTLNFLEREQEKRTKEKKRTELAISMNICPMCGAPIKTYEDFWEVYDKPKRFLFGLIKITGTSWDIYEVCSKDDSHYVHKYNHHIEGHTG